MAGAAIILCDSYYAMDAINARIETKTNVELIEPAKRDRSVADEVGVVRARPWPLERPRL